MDRDPERHSLSPDALQKIYETRVAPRLFRGAQSVEQPTDCFGRPTRIGKDPDAEPRRPRVRGQRRNGEDHRDDLRAYLPHYKSLQRGDDKSAASTPTAIQAVGRKGDCRGSTAPRQCAGGRHHAESGNGRRDIAAVQGGRFQNRCARPGRQPGNVEPWHLAAIRRAKGEPWHWPHDHHRGPSECLARDARNAGPDTGSAPCRTSPFTGAVARRSIVSIYPVQRVAMNRARWSSASGTARSPRKKPLTRTGRSSG